MPEKGWSNITVREATAKKIKQIAHDQHLTIDELLNKLIGNVHVSKSLPSSEWINCYLCGIRLKFKNLPDHLERAHPSLR